MDPSVLNPTRRIMIVSPSQSRWAQPFSLGYAAHTCQFISLQIFLLTRAFFAIETPYEFKLEIVRISNWCSILLLLLGFVLIVPYIREIFHRQEVVVSGGPSLITELGPQLARNTGLLFVIFAASLADYSVRETISLRYAVPVYFLLGLLGIGIAILVSESHRSVLVVSSACLVSAVQSPQWFSDWALVGPVAVGMGLLALENFGELKIARHVLSEIEIEVVRVRIAFLILSGLCMVNGSFKEFGPFCLLSVGACNFFLHVQACRAGSVERRLLVRLAESPTSS